MNEHGRASDQVVDEADASRPESDAERRRRHRKALEEYEAFVQQAIEYEAAHGVWPPDPLLDEVAEMRRQILAEHDNDYGKVLDWYVELGRQRANVNGQAQKSEAQKHP